MALTDTAIKKAKPTEKARKLYDGKGLFLLISPKGSKGWRFKYRFRGKEKLLSMGTYPEITLKQARERRDEARKLVAGNVDPSEIRKANKTARSIAEANSFESVAREWFVKNSKNWSKSHFERSQRALEKDLYPWLGNRPISEITPQELLHTIRRIEHRGAIETAHRALQRAGQIFRYAVATGRTERDVAHDLKGALPPVKPTHLPSITDPKAIGGLLRAIDGYEGSFVTKSAMKLAPLVFVRPGELRHAEWTEIDLKAAEWRIPGHKMKMGSTHIVPLSQQALDILAEIHPLTGHGKYVFPSVRTNKRPMSENTVNAGLRRLGYEKGEMTGHGFRSMASTRLNEMGWNRDAIERQLAHAERDGVRAAYNYAEHLPERENMMQAWADYLDSIKAGAEVVPIRQTN